MIPASNEQCQNSKPEKNLSRVYMKFHYIFEYSLIHGILRTGETGLEKKSTTLSQKVEVKNRYITGTVFSSCPTILIS